MTRLAAFRLALAVLSIPARIAFAQTPDTTSRADSTPRPAPPATTLPAVRVTGSILPERSDVGSAVPARTATIAADVLDAWNHPLLGDALAGQPGMSLYDDLGSRRKTTLVARGFSVSPVVGLPQGISVFVDGVPVNEPDAGQVNFDLLPLEHVERVELLGGTASLQGPHSLGGAVNLVTRRGAGSSAGEVELASGSHDALSASASASGAARGWDYYAGGGYGREGGWRQLTSARAHDGFLNVGRSMGAAGFNLQAFGARSYAETAGSLPLSVYGSRPDSNLSAGDFEEIDQLHLAASGHARLGGGRVMASAHFRRHTAERFNVNQESDPDVRSFSRNRTIGLAADWRTAMPLGAGALSLRVGAGGTVNRIGIRIFAERLAPGLTTSVESPIRKIDGYAVSEFRRGPVTLSGGARLDVVRVPFRNLLDGTRDTTSTFTRVSPRGGISVAVGESGHLYSSVGQSFRPPAVIELACADPEEPCPLPFALGDDPPLDPVVATTYEAGGRWSRGGAQLDAALFLTEVRNDIFLFPYDGAGPSGSTIDGFFANLDRTRRAGVEIAARLPIARVGSISGSYGYTAATFETGDVEIFSIREEFGQQNEVERGDQLPLVPRHAAMLGVAIDPWKSLAGGVTVRHVGERWARGDEANVTAPLDGYTVADARASWSRGAWELAGVVRNVLDRRFAAFGTFNINQGGGGVLERFLTPGPPRSFQLLLRRRFGAPTAP